MPSYDDDRWSYSGRRGEGIPQRTASVGSVSTNINASFWLTSEKADMAKFVFWAFSEVRFKRVLRSSRQTRASVIMQQQGKPQARIIGSCAVSYSLTIVTGQ